MVQSGESIEDEPWSERTSTSRNHKNMEHNRDLVWSNRLLTIRVITEKPSLKQTTAHHVLTNELRILWNLSPKSPLLSKKATGRKRAVIFLKMIRVLSQTSLRIMNHAWRFDYRVWARKVSSLFLSRSICLIWVRVTSFSSRNWKVISKDKILARWKTLKWL